MRRIASLAAVLALVAAAGCQTDSTGPNASIAGTYRLQVINGQNLPYTFINSNGDQIRLIDDQLTISTNGRYEDDALVSVNGGPQQTFAEVGSYSNLNGSITFFDETDNLQYGGSLTGSTLTEISNDGSLTEVFQRQ